MIKELLKDMPDLLTTNDLIHIGFYTSENAAYFARRRGISSPPYIKVGKRVFYPKDQFLHFLDHGGGNGVINAGKGPESWQGGAIKGTDRWKAKNELS
jgi:hypothetical protein